MALYVSTNLILYALWSSNLYLSDGVTYVQFLFLLKLVNQIADHNVQATARSSITGGKQTPQTYECYH